MTHPSVEINLEVEINYGQVYIYSVTPWADDPENTAVLRALDDAHRSGRFVGVADGVLDLVTPVQWNFNAPMRVEVWPQEPPTDDDNWDQVVDIDLDVPTGQLSFEGSGGREPIPCEVPVGDYRARVSGRGYTEAKEGVEGMDSYRVRLWPRDARCPPQLRKSWSGWQGWD
jgi:hypothetical protein